MMPTVSRKPLGIILLLPFILFLSLTAGSDVKVLAPATLAPDNGSFFHWTYEKETKTLFFPVLSSRLDSMGDSQLDELRESGLCILRKSFPQIVWELNSDLPSNKKGAMKRSAIKMPVMASFAVQVCQDENARTGLIALISFEVMDNVPIYKCELLLIDAEASCQVTHAVGWSKQDEGLEKAMTKAADLLAEQPLYVVRPKIALSPVFDEKGKRTGASIPVGSRVGIIKKSELAIPGKNKNGVPSSIGNLEVVTEGVTSSLCKIIGVPNNVELPDGMLCIPVDSETYKVLKPSKTS